MKFISLLLAAGATTSAMADNTSSRGLASLAEKWNITDPTFAYTGLSFDLDYGVSDYIAQGMQSAAIWDRDCAEGNPVLETVLEPTLSSIDENQLLGDGFRTVNFDVTVKPETITSDSNIYTELTSATGELSAVIEFCVRFSLYTSDGTMEVNFHETLVTLNVQLTDGFSIDNVSVEPRDKLVRTANQVYRLEAYQCDQSMKELNELQRAVMRNQGAIIRVCVRPREDARDDGIKMREIQSLSYTRTAPVASQIAVLNSEAANNGLSDLTCNAGDDVCMVETILTADFYREAGIVSGSGIGSMQFGTRRRLRSNERALQQDSAGESQFDLDVETNEGDFSRYASSAASMGASALMGSLFLVIVALVY